MKLYYLEYIAAGEMRTGKVLAKSFGHAKRLIRMQDKQAGDVWQVGAEYFKSKSEKHERKTEIQHRNIQTGMPHDATA